MSEVTKPIILDETGQDMVEALLEILKVMTGSTITIHGKDGEDGQAGQDGADGVSPTVQVTKSNGVTTIKITDANGTKTATINDGANGKDGKDGADGYTPVKGVDYFDGQNGKDGAAGKDGSDGEDGKDGTSPTISVTAITGGHRISITDVNGTKTFDVMDGEDGKDGEDGADGAAGSAGKDGSNGADGQDGEDGVGIASIEQTTTSTADDGNNVITVTLTNGQTFTFTVQNGSKGSAGADGKDGKDGSDATVTIVDNLTTRDATKALSANQGNVLAQMIIDTNNDVDDLSEEIDYITEEVASNTDNIVSLTDKIIASETPPYILTEAERVVKAVQAVRTSKTLVFSAMSDIHLKDSKSSYLDTHGESLVSAQHGGMGLKEIQKRIDLDFIAMLGDYSYMSSNSYTAEQVMKDITLAKKALDISGDKEIWCVGNHDWCYGSGVDRMLTEDEVYAYIGANSDGVKPYDSIERCFGYLDFDNQKIRVIYLNTNDCKDGIDNGAITTDTYQYMEMISPTQMRWFADVALDFTDKADSSEWGVVILSHQPIDYGYGWYTRILELLEAYRNKQSVTLVCSEYYLNSKWVQRSETFDFTGVENPAEIICNVHGHIHNCGSAKVSSNDSDPTSASYIKPWLWRFCVPNMCANRYNEKYDTVWGEVDENGNKVEWTKELDTAKETSFNIISIDRKNKKIYAHIFGAGKDRVFDYDAEYVPQEYAIIATLSNCTGASGNPTTIIEGLTASLVITANDGYELPAEISVSGATYLWDSTSGTLSLSNPTSNVSISIVATAVEVPVVNLIDVTARTHAPMTTPQFVEPEVAHEMNYAKIYDAAYNGRRGSYPSGKVTKFEVLTGANGFTYQVSSTSGYGVEFPVQLEGGKTYELNYTTETNDSSIYLFKYNADTTINAATEIHTAMAAVGNKTLSITAEDGYLYSLFICGRKTGVDFTVKNISLLEV